MLEGSLYQGYSDRYWLVLKLPSGTWRYPSSIQVRTSSIQGGLIPPTCSYYIPLLRGTTLGSPKGCHIWVTCMGDLLDGTLTTTSYPSSPTTSPRGTTHVTHYSSPSGCYYVVVLSSCTSHDMTHIYMTHLCCMTLCR